MGFTRYKTSKSRGFLPSLFSLIGLFILLSPILTYGQQYPFQNPDRTSEERAKDLISSLSLEEKGFASTPPVRQEKEMRQSANAYHNFAPAPVLGWNSWDIFGTTVTEQQIREQADAMAEHLLPAGYIYLTVDIQWYEPESKRHYYKPGAPLTMDEYGRLIPAEKKFPSAAGGKGFKPLADYVHSKGLKLGIHIMRGIPRQAVEKNLPVLGTNVRAADIALTGSTCPWNPDMYGVDATKEEGRAYYRSIIGMYAEWGGRLH